MTQIRVSKGQIKLINLKSLNPVIGRETHQFHKELLLTEKGTHNLVLLGLWLWQFDWHRQLEGLVSI